MTATSDAFPAQPTDAAPLRRTRPFVWSVKRELWENRAIYIGPVIAAAVVLFGVVLGHTTAHQIILNPRSHHPSVMPPILPYAFATGAIVVTSFIVSFFYCLGALNHERRDRSVLFWKSLPVSDLTTVLSKAVLPAVILPLVTLVVVLATHLLMLGMDLAHNAVRGGDASELLANLPLGQVWLDLAYAYLLLAFWWAPLWGWLLLASAWAKRMTFLWGVGPPLAICVVEQMAAGTHYAGSILSQRLLSGISIGFTTPPRGDSVELPWPDPMPFLASPGLWIGLVVAAVFLAGAVWLRRRREPI